MRSWRTAPLPRDWKRIRAKVLRRDGGLCQWPGCTEPATDVDHMGDPNDHRLEMLQSLCGWHHRRKTATEAGRSYRPPSSKRPPEKHPGIA